MNPSVFGVGGAEFTVTHVGADVGIPPIADLEAGATASGDTFVEMPGAGLTLRNGRLLRGGRRL